MYNEIDRYLRSLPGVRVENRKTRISYWRSDETRFCKLEGSDSQPVVTFTAIPYSKLANVPAFAEADPDGRLRLRIANHTHVEFVKRLAERESK